MSENVFHAALKKITDGACSIGELIEAANVQSAAGQPGLAQQLYIVWARLNPDHPQVAAAWFNCAVMQSDGGDLAAAIASLRTALAANPAFLPAYINLGTALERAGKADEAIEQWRTLATRSGPMTGDAVRFTVTALKQMGRVLSEHQQPEPAELALKQALDLAPDQRDVIEQYVALRLGQCKWPVLQPFEGVSKKLLLSNITPLSINCFSDDPLLQMATSVRYVSQAVAEPQDNPHDRRDAPIDLSGRRLRVGYVSSDLRDHAVGYLMAEMLEIHDKSKVEVFAYYCGIPAVGGLNSRIRAAVEHWVDIRELNDDAAAARIAADGIDILVDVNGHTRDARSAMFARRPAPILVNWLGFPGSMGTPYHHYVVADEWIIPPESERYYTEKVLRLPCYQSNDRKRAVDPTPRTRTEWGLPEDGFVFCCFNGVQKITRFSFLRWLEILKRTEGSVLWLLDSIEPTVARLRAFAQAEGVDPTRIIVAPKVANPQHLARYPLADLFLDTAPYGAHTTASDALFMGVPVLTLSGRSFAARVCGSLVRAAGLPELVCTSPDEFVERAVELAHDPRQVAALKAKLSASRDTCDLFNMDKLVDRLEALYGEMVADYQAGRLPQPDLANAEAYLAVGVEIDHEELELQALEDYDGFYRERLAARHRNRPIPPDNRLWTAEAIAEAGGEGMPAEAPPPRRARAANG